MVQQRNELMRRQDFVVIGVDKTVEIIENAPEEDSGRVHSSYVAASGTRSKERISPSSNIALVEDYGTLTANGEPSRERAIALLHPALIAFARQVFLTEWAEAEPWGMKAPGEVPAAL
ncbi:hypothetical protein [Streptomyces sp. NPDC059994]|uniref:hypothetical protein n=1 Tax=Streptomyces sp. NPDC059994 TaxID=3347029 RepID=UPI00368498F3